MAKIILRDLLDSHEVQRVGLADLSADRVKSVAQGLDDRVVPIVADANDQEGLRSAMKDWDVVVNSTWYELNLKVMGAAIESGVHYLDLGGLYHMTLKQMEMAPFARDAGVSCVLGLGSSPGITNLMAAHGTSKMTQLESVKIRVGGASLQPSSGLFNPPYSFRTILDEATMAAAILREGRIEMVPGLSVKEEFILPDPVGKVEGYFTLHSELATLPGSLGKGIREMDFIVAFSPEFSRAVHLLVTLGLASKDEIEVGGNKVVPYQLLAELADKFPRPKGAPSDFGIRRVQLVGRDHGQEVRLVYDCVSGPHERWRIGGRALGTGVPASLGAQWLAAGKIDKPGVFPPERCIDPGMFLHELSGNGRGIVTYEDDGTARKPL